MLFKGILGSQVLPSLFAFCCHEVTMSSSIAPLHGLLCWLRPVVPDAHGGQKGASDLKLESQMVVNHHEDGENQTWVLCKSSEFSYPLSPSLQIHLKLIYLMHFFFYVGKLNNSSNRAHVNRLAIHCSAYKLPAPCFSLWPQNS